MSSLVLFTIFILTVLTILTVTRLLHLLNTLFEHRTHHASLSRGISPHSATTSLSQWDALQSPSQPHSFRARRVMVILGSGGHTGEMLQLLQHVDRSRCAELVYVRAQTDVSSEVRIRQMEEDKKNAHKCKYVSIYRSREVGQSYLSSVPTTLLSIAQSIAVVYTHRPDIVSASYRSHATAARMPVGCIAEYEEKAPANRLCCHSWVCRVDCVQWARHVPAHHSRCLDVQGQPNALIHAHCVLSRQLCSRCVQCAHLLATVLVYTAWQVWLFRSTRVVFIESFCRVRSLSLCGRMVYGLVDRFIVQWPRLTKKYHLSEYCGRLC